MSIFAKAEPGNCTTYTENTKTNSGRQLKPCRRHDIFPYSQDMGHEGPMDWREAHKPNLLAAPNEPRALPDLPLYAWSQATYSQPCDAQLRCYAAIKAVESRAQQRATTNPLASPPRPATRAAHALAKRRIKGGTVSCHLPPASTNSGTIRDPGKRPHTAH